MKLAKSLLLGSAAGLVAVASASAADLPVRKAAPVDYVRVCSAYGAGFFFIPGTDTCLRVSGFVRADYIANDIRRAPVDAVSRFQNVGGEVQVTQGGGLSAADARRRADQYTFFARGRVDFDSRTGTEFGLLRTFTSLDFNSTPGGTAGVNLINAYVQFGGLTAGRIQSFFMYRWAQAGFAPYFTSTNLTYGTTNVLAYTASFGNGFSGTISLEDGNRRTGIVSTTRDLAGNTVILNNTGGTRVPDIVANLDLSQSWGSARLAAALHHNHHRGAAVSDKWGWAVLAGVDFNLPMLAPGSKVWFQGVYADGASNFAGGRADPTRLGYVGGFNTYVVDTTGDGVLNSQRGVKTTSFTMGLSHNWTPQWQSNVHASYIETRFSALGRSTYEVNNWEGWNIGKGLSWTPVAGLLIGGEVQYAQVRGRGPNAFRDINGDGIKNKRTDDVWTARFRIQRSF